MSEGVTYGRPASICRSTHLLAELRSVNAVETVAISDALPTLSVGRSVRVEINRVNEAGQVSADLVRASTDLTLQWRRWHPSVQVAHLVLALTWIVEQQDLRGVRIEDGADQPNPQPSPSA